MFHSSQNLCIAWLALAAIPISLSAQVASGVVAGRVTLLGDTSGAPARGAAVSIPSASLRAYTDGDGRFSFSRVPVGSVALRVSLPGYSVVERQIQVRDSDTAFVSVALERRAQLLSPVRTSAEAEVMERSVATPDIGVVTMEKAAMAGVPSVGEPDVVRVVQLLPGIETRNDFNTGLNVRGGEADQNLVLLDGHPIYNPFHLGGVFSTFMDATVGGVTMITGAFPARYGGRLSSVLDVRSAEDARPGVHASIDLSALATTGRLSGAWPGGRGGWSVAGRRTYADAAAAIFTSTSFPYHFDDLHGHVTYVLPGDVRLGVTAYAGTDVLNLDQAELEGDSVPSSASEGQWAYDWGNRLLGAVASKSIGHATIEQRISTSSFSTLLDIGSGAFSQRSRVRDVRLSGSLVLRGASHTSSFGYELAAYRLRYASGSVATGTTDFDIVQRPRTLGLWASESWSPSARWMLEAGLRAEALDERQWRALSPRLAVHYLATPSLTLTAAAGRATQMMHSLAGDGPLRFFDVWIASDAYVPVSTAWHWLAGLERRIGASGAVRVEGYIKNYPRTLEANWSEDPGRRGDEFVAVAGRSYGADLLARWQPAAGLSGWISYSYGLSARWRDSLRWAPAHDRRHEVDVVATWRLAKYQLGARFGYATGTPFTPIIGGIARRVYDPSLDHWGTGDPQIFVESIGGGRNSARFPPTQRLDVQASRDLRYHGATITPYVSVVNVYNAKNVFVYLYEYSTDHPTRRAISQFPVLPSLGVRVAF